jgi:hypothetical protein
MMTEPNRVDNSEGATPVVVRYMVETQAGWLGAYDAEAFAAYRAAIVAEERERCAKLCEQYADDADQWRPLDGTRGAAVREVARRIRG